MMAYIKLISNKILLGALLLLLAAACSDDSEPLEITPDPDEGREKSVVDISMSFGDEWDIDYDGTRAAPPSSTNFDTADNYPDISDIQTVRVITFRRKEGSEGEFYYDSANDMNLKVAGNTTIKDEKEYLAHQHSKAKGKLTKTYGYEYRVIAIAYSPSVSGGFYGITGINYPEDINKFLTINCDTYSGFCAKLNTLSCSGWTDYLKLTALGTERYTNHINKEILQTPQIFYGTLHSKNNESDIISYAEIDGDGNMNPTVGLTGILRRGVAKVNMKFENIKSGCQWITVLAATPHTKVGLMSYDEFLNPSEPMEITYKHLGKTENKYTAVAYVNIYGSTTGNVSFYILPCMTKLAIRQKGGDTASPLRNGLIAGDGFEMHGNNGTGIVSPDLIDNVFYFRRNHKYNITVSNTEEIVKITNSTHLD